MLLLAPPSSRALALRLLLSLPATRRRDANGNGYLSLAELDLGVSTTLKSATLAAAKPAIMRAFQAAKGACVSRSPLGSDMVEAGEEFRLLLLYLRQYFEVHAMFETLDTSDDHRVDRAEFEAAVPKLKEWGLELGLTKRIS